MKTLIIIGNDKIGRSVVKDLPYNPAYKIVLDDSTSLSRIIKILKKGTLNWMDFFKMVIADVYRKDTVIDTMDYVKNNEEIEEIIKNDKITRVLLFRAGIIINKKLLNNENVDFLNIHCAKIPEYGGIGAIPKALKENAYEQVATLHRVIDKIDDGEVLMTMPYHLSVKKNFKENEDEAYLAGKKLLLVFLEVTKQC